MKTGVERREDMMTLLQWQEAPLSGRWLAERYEVSRQVIVQDIALLRAAGEHIVSTNRGYVLTQPRMVYRTFRLRHNGDRTEEELCTIVDQGGRVVNVSVEHPIYGRLEAPLALESRSKVWDFLRAHPRPAGSVDPADSHCHTVAATSPAILDRVEAELRRKGFLVEVVDRHE